MNWKSVLNRSMKILKFGGTSVGSPASIQTVRKVVQERIEKSPIIVILSAFGGVTDELARCAAMAAEGNKGYLGILNELKARHYQAITELFKSADTGDVMEKADALLSDLEEMLRGIYLVGDLSWRSSDKVLGFGELMSCQIVSVYFTSSGMETILVDPKKLMITDDTFGGASVLFEETNRRIVDYTQHCLADHTGGANLLLVCPGFVSATLKEETTTLGRGGSDYTAAIWASALDAEVLEIWTDVDGVMTADPRMVTSARSIDHLSFQEAMELSHFGAKVIYAPTIQPVLDKNIPIHIKNTFNRQASGTTIHELQEDESRDMLVRGLSSVKDIALLNLTGSGMVGIPKFSFRLFRALSQAKVNVIIITQASSEHSICVGVDAKDLKQAEKAILAEFEYEIQSHQVDPLEVETHLSIVALVGEHMRSHVGVSGQMLASLGVNGINIKAIAQGSSERNITVVIAQKDLKKALNVLHESFFLTEQKRLNLFLIGVGNVGGTLIRQIASQHEYLYQEENIDLRLVGMANSRKMLFVENGIDLDDWEELLDKQGETMKASRFIQSIEELNLRNSVFVDNTASEDIARSYAGVLQKNISVVTPNKIACASSMDYYRKLKATAREYKTKFYYETNVGAGLPIISTLGDLIKSGDKVFEIQAVLSGSLNFIFNQYDGSRLFAEVVRQARAEGYTEPDPRVDLGGSDVMRKILILIRETGGHIEMDQIANQPFIPDESMGQDSMDSFFSSLERHEEHFKKMLEEAKEKEAKLKYVAEYNQGEASVGLQAIDKGHPFYHLEGKDNIVLFYTSRYRDQPLVIKGAGAGAEVTASGIFADIMKIANS